MGLFVGSTPVKSVYVGSTPVTAVYVGSQKVWPTIEVVQITLGTGNQARDQFRAALTARGLNYQTVTEVPFEIELVGTGSAMGMFNGCSSLTSAPEMDTSQVTSMAVMFYDCSALTSVPDLDTSQVTDMDGMFSGCSALTSVPDMDTSQVTNMFTMFYDCSALVSVPDLDTSQVTNMSYMFYNCSSLTDGNVSLIGRHPDVNTTDMITGSGLTREPFYEVVQITLGTGFEARDQFRAALTARGLNYQTVTEVPFGIELVGTGSLTSMFNGCSSLTTVPDLNTSLVTNMAGMFNGCSSLVSVPDLNTSQATNMSYMFNNCSSLVSVPEMDTSQVTTMLYMFNGCSELTSVPDLNTSQVTDTAYMFRSCAALTDGDVRLIGKHPSVSTTNMITGSGLTRLPFFDAAGNPI